jgi:hypothetical protein
MPAVVIEGRLSQPGLSPQAAFSHRSAVFIWAGIGGDSAPDVAEPIKSRSLNAEGQLDTSHAGG